MPIVDPRTLSETLDDEIAALNKGLARKNKLLGEAREEIKRLKWEWDQDSKRANDYIRELTDSRIKAILETDRLLAVIHRNDGPSSVRALCAAAGVPVPDWVRDGEG